MGGGVRVRKRDGQVWGLGRDTCVRAPTGKLLGVFVNGYFYLEGGEGLRSAEGSIMIF